MADDWDESSGEEAAPATAPTAAGRKPAVKSKWEGEDEDENGPVSDWEASSEEEAKPTTAAAAPTKKRGTLKAKLAEKAAEKAARVEAGEDDEDELYDEDAVLDPRAKAKLDRERELKADLKNTEDLLGSSALGGTSSSELDSLISSQPRTKDDFIKLSNNIIQFIIKRHQEKPFYPTFVEHFARELAMPLQDVDVRKVASGLTALANEKQKEKRDKAAGKKKPKTIGKPILGTTKASNRIDTSTYEEALDDFGTNADDFM